MNSVSSFWPKIMIAFHSVYERKSRFFISLLIIVISFSVYILVLNFLLNANSFFTDNLMKNPMYTQVNIYNLDINGLNNRDFTQEALTTFIRDDNVKNYRMASIDDEYVLSINDADKTYEIHYIIYITSYSGNLFLRDDVEENIDEYLLYGRLPINENEILISEDLLRQIGVVENDEETTLTTNQGSDTYDIVGVIKSDIMLGFTGEAYSGVFRKNDNIQVEDCTVITLELNKFSSMEAVVDRVLSTNYYVDSEYEVAQRNINTYHILFVIGLLVIFLLTGSILVNIRATFMLELNEKTRFIGLLKTIGFQQRYIKDIFMCEGLLYFCASIPLMVVFGLIYDVFLKRALIDRVDFLSDYPILLSIHIIPLLLGFATYFSLFMFIILKPIRKVQNISPIEAFGMGE